MKAFAIILLLVGGCNSPKITTVDGTTFWPAKWQSEASGH